MADKLFQDLLRDRDKLVVRMREQSRRSSAALDKASAEDPHELLSRYVARLQEANKAKDEAIERYDEEISHYARLIGEIEAKMAAKRGEEDDAYEHAGESDAPPELPSEPAADSQPDPILPRDRIAKKGAKRKDS